MTMDKMVIFHNLLDENARPAIERWFRLRHVPDVMVQCPWTCKYLMYRPVPAPEGAADAGLYTYRIHENWAPDINLRRGGKGMIRMTPEPGDHAVKAEIIHVPAEPTEDFLGSDWHYDEHTFVRWLIAYRYPKGADKEECDRFFLETQAKEIMKMPGLIRFFSHKAIEFDGPALPITTEDNKITEDSPVYDMMMRHWDRLSELWFECNADWTNALINDPPEFTKPEWATSDRFPFLEPGVDFVHTFILETPDQDFTRTVTPLYY